MWLFVLSILSPDILQLHGYPGEVVYADIQANTDVDIEATYPLQLLSYTNTTAKFKISTDATHTNYTHTTYVISDTQQPIRSALGIPTHTHVEFSTSTTHTPPKKNIPVYLIVLGIIAVLFLTQTIQIRLR